jgi:hypothetical protein
VKALDVESTKIVQSLKRDEAWASHR